MADVGPGRAYGAPTSIDIANTTIACRQSLERCTSIRSLKNQRWAENRLADFNVWDSGLGASSSRRASLEDRLALKPHVRTAVLNLLIIYQNAIEIVLDLGLLHDERNDFQTSGGQGQATNAQGGSQTTQAHEADKEPIVDDSTLSEAIGNADLVLNDLARLAALIRKAGTTSRLSRADATFDPQMQKHTGLREHLFQILLCQPSLFEDRRHIHWDSIDPSLTDILVGNRDDYWNRIDQETVNLSYISHDLTEVQERLVITNFRRSHRFTYSQKHGSKLESSWQQPRPAGNMLAQIQGGRTALSSMSKWNMPSGPKPGAINELEQMHSDQMVTRNYGMENMTDTVASEVETVVLNDFAKQPTPSQQAVTEISTPGSRLQYPKPPRYKPGQVLFTCPCCCVPLPLIFAESRRWRKHLKEDILPYTCVLPRCPKPGTLFAEKSAWLDHMFTDHIASASWVCDICGNTETFTTESDSITHLTDLHQDAIPADQVTLFAELCYKRTTAEISSCPLCSWAEDADGYITNEQLLEHVAEHIHSFALRSLPWAPDKDDHDRNTFERAFEKVEDWFAKCNPDAESSGYKSKLPSAELRENADNYFLTHEYFGESSRASSLAPTLSSVGWDDDVDEDEDESEEHSQSALSFDSGSDRSDNAEDERHDKTQRAIPVSGPQYPRSPITIKVIDDHGQRIFIDPPSPQLAPKPSVDDYHSDESDVNYVRERSTRGSAHVDMDRPLPSCPRSTATTSYDDWYTLQGRHNFDICPSCYEGVFDGTPFAVDFSQTRRGERPTERFCDFSSPWTRLAWLLTIKQRRSSLDLLHAIADITETDRPCPDNVELRSDRITWYGIPDQRDGVHVANFAVCSADKKMVEALLPTMRGYFTRLPTSYASSTLPKYMCSLRTSSRRFPKYLDLLITLDSEAQDLAQRPNINRFSQLARDNALKSECTRDKVFSRKPWMFIPSVPEFTVCEECYDELIRPACQSKSTATTIPHLFNKTMQLVPEEDLETGASCCLYSSRMRKVFDISIKETDLPYLRRKAVERKKTRTKLTRERKQIVNRMLDLDKGSSQWERAKNEIEALDREWATWE